ncbi:L-type lectin-domain containing receptor kinase IX.1-like [Curcuma longa]|uniref:L-type lectin-domain containing receptor kinase IX.1-like n=1 Tax=Curcuma longa TaxID=136217 RepID=UPI003D9FABF0
MSGNYFVFWFLTVISAATSLSFDFSGFSKNSLSSLEFQGDASLQGAEINLTSYPMLYSVGRAVHREPLRLWDAKTRELADFTTRFSFVINAFDRSPAAQHGDGLAFFLATRPSTIPAYSRGAFLGLFGNSSLSEGGVKAVAVEFDTFRNAWDPSADHVGIDVNSIVSRAVLECNSSLKDGRKAHAWVSYNSTTHNLSVFFTYESNRTFRAGDSSLHFIVDLRDELPELVEVGFSASTGNLTEAHSLLSWSFDSSLRVKSNRCRVALEVGLVTGAVVLMAASGLIWFIFFRKKALSSKGEEVDEIECDEIIDDEFERAERGPKRYPYEELAGATRNFSKEGKLGEGGFGSVYKGYLKDLKLDVAIKKISRGSKQGRKEYVSEVKIISQLRHRNLVQLVGWCHDRRDFLLVYEFMPNGSLDSYLYTAKKTMEWPVRHKVALGLASALLYLHEEWERCVVHRDIKPSNVMLDSAFNAKLGDFGLARLVDHDSHSQTTVLAGTMGYLAPECVTTGKASKETDVYSFGVVALEIACGRRPMEPAEEKGKVRLVEWVWELYGRATVLEAADAKLQGKFDARQMECLMAVGLWCVHPDCNLRPTIRQAINALNFETPLPELPPKMPVPIYFAPPVELVAASFTHTSSLTDSSMVNSYVTDSSNSILMNADAVKPQKTEATPKCD